MGIKERLIRLGDIPVEHNEIRLVDDTELYAQNCLGITHCDENIVEFENYRRKITVTGTGLIIENYGASGLKIIGNLHSLTMEEL